MVSTEPCPGTRPQVVRALTAILLGVLFLGCNGCSAKQDTPSDTPSPGTRSSPTQGSTSAAAVSGKEAHRLKQGATSLAKTGPQREGGSLSPGAIKNVQAACAATFGKVLPQRFQAGAGGWKLQEPLEGELALCDYDRAFFDVVPRDQVEADNAYGWGSFSGAAQCREHTKGVYSFECRAGRHVVQGTARYDDSTAQERRAVKEVVRRVRDYAAKVL